MLAMQYQMKQKLFSWGDDFTITDENDAPVFFVDGKAFSFGDQLSFQDMSGNELAYIKQKLLSFGPSYEVYRQGELAAVVKKELFTFFSCSFYHAGIRYPFIRINTAFDRKLCPDIINGNS